jgi:hypothetical protein
MKGDLNCPHRVTVDSLAEDIRKINIRKDAETLDSVQLTTNEWNWVMSMPNEFVDLYIVDTDPKKRICGLRGNNNVTTHWTVRRE